VTLASGSKIVVLEDPDCVVGEIRQWRADILSDALSGSRRSAMRAIEGSPPPADHQG
jgi:hypothetical protein